MFCARALACSLVLTGLILPAPCRASYVYTLDATDTVGGGGQTTLPLDLRLTMSDAAVGSGSFSATRNCSGPGIPYCTGVTGDFRQISLVRTNGGLPSLLIGNTPDTSFDQTNVSLTFGPGGVISSGSIFEGNSFFTLNTLTIAGSLWSAKFNSDAPPYEGDCGAPGCSTRGNVYEEHAVPEPSTLAVFGTALLGLWLVRRWIPFARRPAKLIRKALPRFRSGLTPVSRRGESLGSGSVA